MESVVSQLCPHVDDKNRVAVDIRRESHGAPQPRAAGEPFAYCDAVIVSECGRTFPFVPPPVRALTLFAAIIDSSADFALFQLGNRRNALPACHTAPCHRAVNRSDHVFVSSYFDRVVNEGVSLRVFVAAAKKPLVDDLAFLIFDILLESLKSIWRPDFSGLFAFVQQLLRS